MSPGPRAFVLEADVRIDRETDPGALGAAVTTELCGHWEHEGPCRWPHNNAVEAGRERATFRTVFVAPAEDEAEVRQRILHSLRAGSGWELVEARDRPLHPAEESLARRMAGTLS